MYSNRRRSHIHFIHQYKSETRKYTGTRIVVFDKDKGLKEIEDLGNFKTHTYENPKDKNHKISKWTKTDCILEGIIKKEMINESVDKKYLMSHILYESVKDNIRMHLEKIIKLEMDNINNTF